MLFGPNAQSMKAHMESRTSHMENSLMVPTAIALAKSKCIFTHNIIMKHNNQQMNKYIVCITDDIYICKVSIT